MPEPLSGATRVVFIAGDPIAQVKAPEGVTAALRARGVDAIVVPIHVAAVDFADFVRVATRARNVDGLIATVPHKFAAAAACAGCTGRARITIGSTDPHGHDLVCNATPLGMRPGDPDPVQVARLDVGTFVGDVVTVPAVPPLIRAARERGCATSTGSDMFACVHAPGFWNHDCDANDNQCDCQPLNRSEF